MDLSVTMASYIALLNFTDQGIRNIKDTTQRAEAAQKLAQQCGVTMKAFSGRSALTTSSCNSRRRTTNR